MKCTRKIMGLLAAVLITTAMGACSTAPVQTPTIAPPVTPAAPASPALAAQIQQLNDLLTAASQADAQLRNTIDNVKATASTQPTVAQQVNQAVAPVEKVQAKVDAALTQAAPVVQAAATASSQPNATPLGVITQTITAAAPLIPPPYNAYVSLGLLGLSVIGNVIQNIKNQKTTAAASANTDAVASGIANKTIVIAPNAGMAADAIVAAHPIGDRLVDVINAGATTKP